MPLVVFDIVQGRTADQIAAILDATHAGMLESFGVPARDQYQASIASHRPRTSALMYGSLRSSLSAVDPSRA